METKPMQNRVWLITGCSTGFGRILARRALERGERVVATARRAESIQDLASVAKRPGQLLTLELDVTQLDQIRSVVGEANQTFGRIDVLINNAGYGSVGALEEFSSAEIRRVFETNVFGLMEMTRAVLPIMRAQKSGHIMNLSSVAGMVSLPGATIYASTKFAVEGLTEGLAGELAPFGIRVYLIEPGGVRTDFANRSLYTAPYLPEYAEALASTRKYYETIGGQQPGDPEACARVMMELIDHPSPPLRLPMGKVAVARIKKKLEQYQTEISTWEAVAASTDYS
jgi:NAD(P)-dependent dehydrogenase (short-subunit alcohol dehydrogenase family)